MTELEKQFAINYYQWAKADFRREFDEGFPILSRLPCSASLNVPEFVATLPDDEQWRFALALLRRGRHRQGAELCGEFLSEKEHELLDRSTLHFDATLWTDCSQLDRYGLRRNSSRWGI